MQLPAQLWLLRNFAQKLLETLLRNGMGHLYGNFPMSSMPIFQSTCKQLLLEFVETLTHALAAKSVFKPFSAVHGRLKEGYLVTNEFHLHHKYKYLKNFCLKSLLNKEGTQLRTQFETKFYTFVVSMSYCIHSIRIVSPCNGSSTIFASNIKQI